MREYERLQLCSSAASSAVAAAQAAVAAVAECITPAEEKKAQVAKRLGVTPAQVARIERRGYEDCTLDTLRCYVQALGVDDAPSVQQERVAEPITTG